MALVIRLLILLVSLVGIWNTLLTPAGKDRVKAFILSFWTGTVEIAAPMLAAVEDQLLPIVDTFASAFAKFGPPIEARLKQPFADLAAGALGKVSSSLTTKRNIKPQDWEAIAGDAMADAFGFGLSSFAVSAAFEAAFPEKLNTLNGVAPMLATMAGFSEVTSAALRPLFTAGIARPGGYDANSKFRSLLPNVMEASILLARRKITPAQFQVLLAFNGMAPEYETGMEEISFRPLSPFILGRLADDTGFDETKTRDALADMGFRDSGIDLAIEGFKKLSLKSHRAGAVGAVIATFEKGLMDDAHFDQMLTDLEIDVDAKTLIKTQALEKRLVGLTEDFKKAWDDRLIGGTITPADYRVALAGLGYVAPILDALVGIGQARTEVAVAKEEHKQQEATIRKTQTELTLAAMISFKKGDLNALELAAGLTAIGLAPAVVAGYVALAEARGVTKPKVTKPKPALATTAAPKP